ALSYQVADIGADQVLGLGYPGDRFAVAAIQGESHVDTLARPAADLEAVAAPAHVASRRGDLAVVRPDGAAGVPGQQQPRRAHHAIQTLVIDPGSVALAIEHRPDAPVPVTAAPVDHGTDASDELLVAGVDLGSTARLARPSMG